MKNIVGRDKKNSKKICIIEKKQTAKMRKFFLVKNETGKSPYQAGDDYGYGFGILDEKGRYVVPLLHRTKISAISEFRYFEEDNLHQNKNCKYLDHTLTQAEIDQVCESLFKQCPFRFKALLFKS